MTTYHMNAIVNAVAILSANCFDSEMGSCNLPNLTVVEYVGGCPGGAPHGNEHVAPDRMCGHLDSWKT